MKIVKQKITNPSTNSMDSDITGKVYFWENKVFRAINKSEEARVNKLFDCGLMAELQEKQLIPKTWITHEFELDGYDLLLQHELIPVNLRPNQWSSEMFVDATKLILNVNHILGKYGFTLQDAHAYNIMFYGSRPIYVDIGSFLPLESGYTALNSFVQEYIAFFHTYVKIIDSGRISLFRSLMNSYERGFDQFDYLSFKYGNFFLRNRIIRKILNLKYNKLYYNQPILEKFYKRRIKNCEIKKSPHDRSDYRKATNEFNIEYFSTELSSINIKLTNSFWGEYHKSILTSPHFTQERFIIIAELVKKLNINTAIEIGGNQGLFSNILLEKKAIQRVICSDYDEDALNAMYQNFKRNKLSNAYSMYLDFSNPYSDPKDQYGMFHRVKQELVIMLAVSHHLILTQQLPIDFILDRLTKFTTKYVLIEFMPLGLYDPDHPDFSIKPPDWYNEEWFINHFKTHFELIHREQTEVNRIAFIGQLKEK